MENYLEIKCSASSRVLFMDFYSGKSSYYWQPMEEMYCCDRLVLYVQKLWGDCGPSTPELWSMKFGCLEFNGLCLGFFFFLAKSDLWSMIFGLFNARSFEGRERTILDLKKLLFFSFF